MGHDSESGSDSGPSSAGLTPATTPPRSPRPGSFNAASHLAAGKGEAAQTPDAEKSAELTTSLPTTVSIAHDQANILSLLCLIASSVLASAAKSAGGDPQKADAAPEPDPPEVTPDDLSSDKTAVNPAEASSSAEPAPTEPCCKHCAGKQPAEDPAKSGKASGMVKPAAAGVTPETAATGQKPADQAAQAAPDSSAPRDETAQDKPAPESSSADSKPATDDKASPDAIVAPEASTETASTPEPQTPTEEVVPSVEAPTEDTPAADDGATAGAESGETAAESADAAKATEAAAADAAQPVKTPEPPKPTEAAKPEDTAAVNPSAPKLPDWFLGNNVVLYEDLTKRPSILQLFKAKASSKPDAKADARDDTKPDAKDDAKPDANADENAAKAADGGAKEAGVEADSKKDDSAADNETAKDDAAAEPASDPTPEPAAEVACTCKIHPNPAPATPETQAPAETNKSEDKPAEKPVYQLHQNIYDEALDLLSAALQPPAIAASTDAAVKKAPPESWITQSSFLVQSPKDGSLEFLDEVVRQVGRDVQADIVMMELDDLEDLCHQFWKDTDEVRTVGAKYLTSPVRLVGEFFGYSKPDEKSKAAVSCILGGPASKREIAAKAAAAANGTASTEDIAQPTAANASAADAVKSSVVVPGQPPVAADILQAGVKDAFDAATKILQAAIREAFATTPIPGAAANGAATTAAAAAQATAKDATEKEAAATTETQATPAAPRPLILCFRNVEMVGKQTPLQRLVEGVNKVRREKGLPVVLVGTAVSNSTSESKPTTGISKAWDGMGLDDSTVINVSPRNTRRASEALKKHGARTRPRAKWRLLRRSIRVTLDQHPTVTVDALYPSGPPAGESVVDELEDEHRRQTLADWDDTLSARVVRQVSARAVRAGNVTPADVFDVMERVMKNQAILNKMNEAGDDDFVGEDGDSDEEEIEFGGPVKKSKVKALLDSITDSCSDAEKEYFDCVVDTVAVSSAAQGIHMDQSLMDSLKQLLSLRTSKPYGLLAKEAVNGAILYGPPGTGKTHLARVVAASSGTNLIVATPADIQNMWVGETEKRIKALFSLGTKLAPCVIFLDEGDSVFGRRQSRDRDWQRKAMSQFLMEMDGLVSRKKAPFLMVATNRPGDIDEAVCRRLPHTLHIGMPTAAGRRAILDIYLKDEKLDEKLDLDEVASDSMTRGFSGSDIRTLCVQAAMAAHKSLEAEKKAALEEAGEGKDKGEGGGEGDEDGGDAAAATPAVDEKAAGSQKRVIKMEHFKTALERTRPSVTRESLMEIERFTGQSEESGDHRAMYI